MDDFDCGKRAEGEALVLRRWEGTGMDRLAFELQTPELRRQVLEPREALESRYRSFVVRAIRIVFVVKVGMVGHLLSGEAEAEVAQGRGINGDGTVATARRAEVAHPGIEVREVGEAA